MVNILERRNPEITRMIGKSKMNDDTLVVIQRIAGDIETFKTVRAILTETIHYEYNHYLDWYSDPHPLPSYPDNRAYRQGHSNSTAYRHALAHAEYDVRAWAENRLEIDGDAVKWQLVLAFLLG